MLLIACNGKSDYITIIQEHNSFIWACRQNNRNFKLNIHYNHSEHKVWWFVEMMLKLQLNMRHSLHAHAGVPVTTLYYVGDT